MTICSHHKFAHIQKGNVHMSNGMPQAKYRPTDVLNLAMFGIFVLY